MQVQLIPISAIRVYRRIRPLTGSVKPYTGTELPITVCAVDGELILGDGLRRLTAARAAKMDTITALVLDRNPLDVEQGEFARQEYTDYERLAAARILLENEEVEAGVRMRAGIHPGANCAGGRALTLVAKRIGGISARKLEMGLAVLESGRPDLISMLSRPRKVHSAYKRLTRAQAAHAAKNERPTRTTGWKAGEITCADCLPILRTIPAETFHAAVFDPPFGLGKRYGTWTEPDNASEYWRWFRPRYSEIMRVLKPGGACIFWQSQRYMLTHFAKWYGSDAHVFASCKQGATFLGDGIHLSWDPVVILWKEGKKLLPAHPANSNDFAVSDVHDVPALAKTHPYAKPQALCKRLLNSFVIENALVLDPFCGTGSIPLACKETGRDFVAIEMNPEHAAIAQKLLIKK